MLDIYYTYQSVESDAFIRYILTKYYNIRKPVICKSINGKPYEEKEKIQFNLTHTKSLIALAVGKKQVGFDCESITGKPRPAVLAKFSEREKSEIFSTLDFYVHWTAKESYIKFLGETLAAYWRKVEFYGGKIYLRGEPTDVSITQFEMENHIFSICGDYTKTAIHRIELPSTLSAK